MSPPDPEKVKAVTDEYHRASEQAHMQAIELSRMNESQATSKISTVLIEWRLAKLDKELLDLASANIELRLDRLEQAEKRRDKAIGRIWTAILAMVATILGGLVIWYVTSNAETAKAEGGRLQNLINKVISHKDR